MEEFSKHTPLRILITTDTVGGVWSYTLELCSALLPHQVEFHVVTTGALMLPAQKLELEALPNVTAYQTDFKLEWMESPWQSIDDSGAWLLRLEEELQPDLIHLNCFAYGSLPWKAPVMVVAHSDVWSWYLSVKHEPPPEEWAEYYKRIQDGLRHADVIIAPSRTMMNFIRHNYVVDTPGRIIYNGRSAAAFKPAKKQPVVFSMGRIWDEAKNVRLLIDAAPQIPYEIRIAGDNSFHGNVMHTGAGGNLSYLGKLTLPEIAAELSVASVYVHPAKYEPFGLSVLEAALSGCALVLGDIDSLREIWRDNAIYVDVDNVSKLAATVNELLLNNALRSSYAEKAMKQASKYTTSLKTNGYLSLYHDLVRENIRHKEIQ